MLARRTRRFALRCQRPRRLRLSSAEDVQAAGRLQHGDCRGRPARGRPDLSDVRRRGADVGRRDARLHARRRRRRAKTSPLAASRFLKTPTATGRYDKATVFLDNLLMPRAVLPIRGGALVAEPPNLVFYKDTDGDGKADQQTIVATDYGTKRRTARAHGQQPHPWPGQLDLQCATTSTAFGSRAANGSPSRRAAAGSGGCRRTTSAASTSITTAICCAPTFFRRQYLGRNPYLRSNAGQNVKMIDRPAGLAEPSDARRQPRVHGQLASRRRARCAPSPPPAAPASTAATSSARVPRERLHPASPPATWSSA